MNSSTHTTSHVDFNRIDATRLGEHVEQCDAALGRLHSWYCFAESVNAFLAPRLVTTTVLLSLTVLPCALLLR